MSDAEGGTQTQKQLEVLQREIDAIRDQKERLQAGISPGEIEISLLIDLKYEARRLEARLAALPADAPADARVRLKSEWEGRQIDLKVYTDGLAEGRIQQLEQLTELERALNRKSDDLRKLVLDQTIVVKSLKHYLFIGPI